MIVSKPDFDATLSYLKAQNRLGLDSESTGLRMYHGDRIFSLILATPDEAYYFNFLEYPPPDFDHDFLLKPVHMAMLQAELFDDENKLWFIQNAANFDLPIMFQSQLLLRGTIHCTKAIGRVVRNDEREYSLASQLQRIGRAKSEAVEEYITKHKLFTVIKVPGKKDQVKLKHFDKVPFDIIGPYGELDGTGVAALGEWQCEQIAKQDAEIDLPPNRSLTRVMENERRLQKTIFRMKDVGVQIDTKYCERAIAYENDLEAKAKEEFKRITGKTYLASGKLFGEVFADEKENWGSTKKGNPSFDSDVLAGLKSPAAKEILKIRDGKSKSDFYNGFLYHADSRGILHPNFNPEGTIHGRFSSSDPNFQNLTKEDSDEEIASEFIVRRAIIPRPGFFLIMPDFQQMEYKFALEMACRVVEKLTPLGEMIVAGHDFHDATGSRVREVAHKEYPRKIIKNANFLTLYGGGDRKLAETLGIPQREAKIIRASIKQAAPEINKYIETVMAVAEQRKYVINWLGRRNHFVFRSMSYRAPNYLISGGCADIVKIAMNRIDEYLLGKKSRLIMSVHDELPIEVHESEDEVPSAIHAIMEGVFESKYIPLTVGMEYSIKSLGDKIKGFP